MEELIAVPRTLLHRFLPLTPGDPLVENFKDTAGLNCLELKVDMGILMPPKNKMGVVESPRCPGRFKETSSLGVIQIDET